MILIADSGSTKTDWRLVNSDKQIQSFQTIGFNPYYIAKQQMLEELSKSALADNKISVTHVYFYGAGCSSFAKSSEIKQTLNSFFSNAEIEVSHDLLAAARALCREQAGLVAILGTGSNSCFFDGRTIVKNVSSLGFILGDEGSGAHLGKTFIQTLLNKEISLDIQLKFDEKFNLTLPDILDAVYKKPLPNRFLAQFVPFILENKSNNQINDIIHSCFQSFFTKHVCKYENYQQYPLHIVGSVGYVFKTELEKVANSNRVELGKIIKQPVDELVKYHLGN